MKRARYFVRQLIRSDQHPEPLYVFRTLPDVTAENCDVGARAFGPRAVHLLDRWALIEPGSGADEVPWDQAADGVASLEAL